MARSRREQLLIIGVSTAVGIFALDRYVVGPFLTARDAIAQDVDVARTQAHDTKNLLRKERAMKREWAGMRTAGIETGTWDAERQLLRSMQTWAQQAGVTNVSLRPERSATEHGFVKVTIHVTGTGPSAAMAKLLWSIESATVPVRVDTLQLSPGAQKENTDELRLMLAASRLCAVPENEQKPEGGRQAIAAGAGEVRP